jgi:iron complex outermembrane receptor protein
VQQSVARTVDGDRNPLNAVSQSGIILRWKDQLILDWKLREWGASLTNNFQSGYYVITAGSYFQTGYDPSWYDPHGQTAYVSANYTF